MNIPKKQKPIRRSFYIFEDIEDMLRTICLTYELNASQVIRILIQQEYDNIFLLDEKLEQRLGELTEKHKNLDLDLDLGGIEE